MAQLLDHLDVSRLWDASTESERRTLLDEPLGEVTVHPDRLVVEVHGAPALNVAFSEVGLKAPDSEIGGVGGGTRRDCYQSLATGRCRVHRWELVRSGVTSTIRCSGTRPSDAGPLPLTRSHL